jgi:fructose-1,6-bisphosphatase/inositol monophosphatase family enzyme
VVEAGLSAHDVAALIPIIEGIGGIVTDWHGNKVNPLAPHKLQLVAAANRVIHEELLEILAHHR